MRVTAEAKTATRRRILEEARRLFLTDGWEATTTRKIATSAGIATGTLFNYFQSKEALAETLIREATEPALRNFPETRSGDESLEEELFAFVWTGLKALRPLRRFMAPVAETLLSPLRQAPPDDDAYDLRVSHLETVDQILVAHGIEAPVSSISLQLYWTLYLGVFGYWTRDESRNQEDTMALADQSLKLYVASLGTTAVGSRQKEGES
jgi:AcrR family transcriptional regulator